MKITSFFCLILIVPFISVSSLLIGGLKHYDNAGLQTVEIVTKYGYPVETHLIESEDGYITTLHRIPHGPDQTKGKRPVILLYHGLACSDNIFVLLGPKKALGFLLADRGYDVWLGNARGSRYSKKHVRYSTKDPQYWDFSFHEMGFYDLAKAVDFILDLTQVESLTYLGHSMGNAIAMVLLTTRPEYNEKINFIFSLAPAVFTGNLTSLPLIFSFEKNAASIKLIGHQESFPPDLAEVLPGYWKACGLLTTAVICRAIYALIGGPSTSLAQSSLPGVYSVFPTSSSAKTYAHYLQSFKRGTFKMYDYGAEKNMILYQSREAPDYNLSLVTVPVLIFYSDGDYAVQAKDTFKLNNVLPNSKLFRVPELHYSHLDYVFGETSVDHVYKEIFKILDKL